ncbi:MAG TPA: hypothetical protein PK395_15725 [bacterium]|nr:hypothetical protein [bacterium]
MADVPIPELTECSECPDHQAEERAPRFFPVMVLLGVVGLFCLGPVLSPHGNLSYSYLRSVLFDGDLNIGNEATQWGAGWPRGVSLEPRRDMGLPSNPAAPGPAIFWTPFFFSAYVLVSLLQFLGWPHLNDGYNDFYYLGLNIGTMFYILLGSGLTAASLWRLFRREFSLAWVAIGVLGSPLLGKAFWDGSLPDAFSFFAAAFVLFEWLEYREDPRSRTAIMLGTAAGVFCLVRPLNVFFCVWPIFDIYFRSKDSRRIFFWDFLSYVLSFTITFSPQWLIWREQSGHPWPIPAVHPEWNLRPVDWLASLFSWEQGLFVRYPILLLGIAGLVAFAVRDRQRWGMLAVACFLTGIFISITATAPWLSTFPDQGLALSSLPFAIVGVVFLFGGCIRLPFPVGLGIGVAIVLWTVYCEFSVLDFRPAAFMIARFILGATDGIRWTEIGLTGFLIVGILAICLLNCRIYREITDLSANLPLLHPSRRIGIWVVVILAVNLVIYVTHWSQHRVLTAKQAGLHAYRIVPNMYNRFGSFKAVGLRIEIPPGQSTTLYLSPPHAVNSIYLVSRMEETQEIPLGTPVAQFSVQQPGRSESVLMEFGEETVGILKPSEIQLPDTAGIYEWQSVDGHIFRGCASRLDLPQPVIAGSLVMNNLIADATLCIHGLGFRPSPIRVVSPDRLRAR